MKTFRWINKIGKSVNAVRDHVNLSSDKPEKIIVVHDDIMQPIGEYKIYQGPNVLKYNALQSLNNSLESDQYIRIAIGVGSSPNPFCKVETRDHVMKDLDYMEIAILKDQVFPKIINDHVKELNFKTEPERILFVPNNNLKLANEP